MPDNTIQVVIEGRESGVTASVDKTIDSLKNLKKAADDTATAFGRAGGAIPAFVRPLQAAAEESRKAVPAFVRPLVAFKGAAEEAAGASGNLGMELRHTIAIFDEFARGARGQMVGSITAMLRDSGRLGSVIGALKTPFGLAGIAAAGFAAVLADLAYQAEKTEAAMLRVYRATSLITGMNPAGAEAGARAGTAALRSSGIMSRSASEATAAQIYSMPIPAPQQNQLLSLAPSLYFQMGRNQEELSKYLGQFKDLSGLQGFIKKYGGIGLSQAPAVAQAEQNRDADALRQIVLDNLKKRLSGVGAAIGQANVEANRAASGAGRPWWLPPQLGEQMGAAAIGAGGIMPSRPPIPPAGALPDAIERALRLQQEYNSVLLKRQRILADIAQMKGGAGTPQMIADAERQLKLLDLQQARLDKRAEGLGRTTGLGGRGDYMRGLETQLAQQNAAIATRFAGGGGSAGPAMKQADTEIASMMRWTGQHLSRACAEIVNQALHAAGLPTTGSNLASSFARYGQPVAAGQVRRGDIFLAGPSMGATGHVGVALGPVINGLVQVISSHLQGAASNPAGIEYRSAAGLVFRRPAGAGGLGTAAAARMAELQNTVAFWQHAQATAGPRPASDMSQIARRLAEAQKALASEQITANARQAGAAAEALARSWHQTEEAAKQAAEKAKQYAKEWARAWEEWAKKVQAAQNEAWNKFAGPIENKISDALTNAILGIREKGGLREVMLGIEKSAVGGVVNNVVKSLGQSLLQPAFNKVLGTGIGGMIFGGGKETIFAGAVTTFAAAVQEFVGGATLSAGAATTSAGGSALSAAGSAGGLLGGIKTVGSWIGGFFGFAHGGIVPSAAGGWSLPAFAGAQPALLHSREMVLPADISEGLQGMIRGGGGGDTHIHNHFHGPADGASVGRWFSSNKGAMAGALREAMNSGALAFP